MTPAQFDEQVAEVAKANGLSAEEAGRIVAELGDTLILNDAGKVEFEGRELIWPE